jgi:hypothetical protein
MPAKQILFRPDAHVLKQHYDASAAIPRTISQELYEQHARCNSAARFGRHGTELEESAT